MTIKPVAGRRLRITVLDLLSNGSGQKLWGRFMKRNLASIMPQIVAVWCEQLGHDVRFACFTGAEDLETELDGDTDVLFIQSFTRSAQLAYAISNLARKKGAITVLGGPHARCYPEDAAKYFDYVLGFTDKTLIDDVLSDCEEHRPYGQILSSLKQPTALPSVEERWKFIEPVVSKSPAFKMVSMIGSMGCPYSCSFCIDSTVEYEPLPFEQLTEDLRFIHKTMPNPIIGWHDPNFGIRFDDYMNAIERAAPAGSIRSVAESSLSLLSEPNLKRLRDNGFVGMLPGIESWYDCGNKSKTGRNVGRDKMLQVSDHINMILEYIPYVQTNFVLGLDSDEGQEPFELTKQFLDRAPGAFPAFSLRSAFGRAAPVNLELQQEGRVLPFPFHFLSNNHAMNVVPQNYSWTEFYDNLIDVTAHAFSWPMIGKRLRANRTAIPKWLNVVRGVSSEGFGRLRYHTKIRNLLETDTSVQRYFAGETTELPDFYAQRIKNRLGPLYKHLPEGAIEHDAYAYSKSSKALAAE